MVIKKDAGGSGFRVGGNGDPGRGLLIKTEISISTVITVVVLLVGGIQVATVVRAQVDELDRRVNSIEGNRFTSRDARGLQTNLRLEVQLVRSIVSRIEEQLVRMEDRQYSPDR